jgi:hypothetical protein
MVFLRYKPFRANSAVSNEFTTGFCSDRKEPGAQRVFRSGHFRGTDEHTSSDDQDRESAMEGGHRWVPWNWPSDLMMVVHHAL